MPTFALRIYYLITGRCVRFKPGEDGVCVVCRIPGSENEPREETHELV